jgi:CRP-like cAMP-binding protein
MLPVGEEDAFKYRSRFLSALGTDEFRDLRPHMQLVTAKLGEVLRCQGESPQFVYFPINACVSIVNTVEEGRGVEVARVGSEGMVGLWAALGSKATGEASVVQVPGACVRIKIDIFRAQLKRSSALVEHLHRYMLYLMTQISLTAACNRLHRLDQRLARWLLITHDHAGTDEFLETHEFLSQMLGSDRSEVTLAAGLLRKSGLISYARGKVKVINRKGLQNVCCGCYRVFSDEYQTFFNESLRPRQESRHYRDI